ncbi:MAG: hypothetical protein D3903_15195, partial [Candidatus Electrothrix sp. GM3_4]|nr:hypothetical protein [Candidatus Electrothrix sp. GM3_4]
MTKQNKSVNTHPKFTQQVVFNFLTVLFISFASSTYAADLQVMKTGLGKGWIEGPGISCGIVTTDVATDTDTTESNCNATSDTSITLTANSLSGSTFASWGGDCTGTNPTCIVPMDTATLVSVRANFTLDDPPPELTVFTPKGIGRYLETVGSTVNTQAEFVAALPEEFRQNWILMTRSESLQTGTGEFPRILLVSEDSEKAFSLGLAEHSSYPGSHPNAIEYMQWDNTQKNFRFHEIVIKDIPNMDKIAPGVFRFPKRARGFTEDDPKCFACHSTQNVRNRGTTPGTTGNPIGSVKWKNKPNWDTYDSWGGMLAFNRDRIYKGSIEAAAFRKLMNLWSWQTNEAVRSVIEQLELQPPWVTDTVRPQDRIKRWDTAGQEGGPTDGHIYFDFDFNFDEDLPSPEVENEPIPIPETVEDVPIPEATVAVDYTFNRSNSNVTPSTIVRNNVFVVLQHSKKGTGPRFGVDEGRGTNFFNNLYQDLNPQRIVDEISPQGTAINILATGSTEIDVRPIALAIAQGCIKVKDGSDITLPHSILGVPSSPATAATAATAAAAFAFFDARNGMKFNDLYADTFQRAASISRRKADIQKLNLDRAGDVYVDDSPGADPVVGLIDMHESSTDGIVPST